MDFESEKPKEEINESVKVAFGKLKERMNGRDLMFKNESGDERYFTVLNSAGGISIHSYDTGYDYLLWEDGKITKDDNKEDNDPEKVVDEVATQELNDIIQEIDSLKEEEMEHPEYVKKDSENIE